MLKSVLLLIILSMTALSYFILVSGSRTDKKYFMHYEKCDKTSCAWCIDKEQCKRN